MREIEEITVRAFYNRKSMKRYNSIVVVYRKTNIVEYYLHKNRIAKLEVGGKLTLSSCGWRTATTKSRLNAILDHTKYRIYQENYVWYLYDRETEKSVIFDDNMELTI
jgi:capsule polysaccharide export protein KpsE/RkpR